MKKLKHSFLALSGIATLLLATGCKSEFDVTTDYQVTPIIFGLLDQSEEYHYIRINKTFLGQGNAYDFAKVADSSYFDQVDAKVIEVGTGREWQLRDTILENKNENGAFYAPQHKLYYFWTKNTHADPNNPSYTNPDDPLNPDAVYRLEANINNGEHIVKGQTKLVSNVTLQTPIKQTSFALRGTQPGDYKGIPIVWSTGSGSGGRNSRYNVKFIFHWDEYTGGIPTSKSFTWNLSELSGENYTGGTISVSVPGEQFFQMVRDRIPIDPSVERRLHTKVEIILTAGAEDLTNYMLAAQPSSSLAQSKPTYTNIEGAIGLFSARYTHRFEKLFVDPVFNNYRTLDQNSMRELCEGPYTYELDFCSNHPIDNNPLNPMSFRCQ